MTSHNTRRANEGSEVLAHYLDAVTDNANGNVEDDLTDLITNLLHYAEQQGLDTGRILNVAKMHYEAESADDELNGEEV